MKKAVLIIFILVSFSTSSPKSIKKSETVAKPSLSEMLDKMKKLKEESYILKEKSVKTDCEVDSLLIK